MLSLLALSAVGTVAVAGPSVKRFAAVPPVVARVDILGNSTSNLPNIYRDGGGGGTIGGRQYVIFSDGIYTTGGTPKFGQNWANFTSNSIAYSNWNGGGPQQLFDWGNTEKGPVQPIPFKYGEGESDSTTGIWPNENIVTSCDGNCGITFPLVIRRSGSESSALYSTGIKITINPAFGQPIVERPTKALFYAGEPLYGTFSTIVGIDGYFYTYAGIDERKGRDAANGIKVARVPWGSWADRSAYRFWNGDSWVSQIPSVTDTRSTILKFNRDCFGESFGVVNGDVLWSPYYGLWLMVFQSFAPVCDDNVYIAYSSNVERGWSEPVPVWRIPSAGSFSYALHAYPAYDASGKTLTLSWTQQGPQQDAYYIAWARITFA
ncbi:hypothetical protein AURDEDRAFT_141506 [Auricularia subglabra TFB-10046 SS5]|nr:hypothetical protein AURDEDRAFT_141506 [Auricularia subglabra TFB-10046 SS5]